MSEQREVEGVLLVCADDQEAAGRRVAALEAVDRFDLRPRPPQRIRDVYVDTGDGALAAARVAFRVRELDGRPLLTLKSAPVRTGLAAERLELEAPWSAEALQVVLEELRRRDVQLPTPARRGRGTPGGAPVNRASGRGSRWPTWPPRPAADPAPRERPHPQGRAGPRAAGGRAGGRADHRRRHLPAPGRPGAAAGGRGRGQGPGGLETVQALLEALAAALPDDLRPWPYGKGTGRAVERLLAAGELEGLLDPAGRVRPAAHDRLAEFLAKIALDGSRRSRANCWLKGFQPERR